MEVEPEIVRMGQGDDARVRAAGHLFDQSPDDEATAKFLADPGHHLLIAYIDGTPAGFVSGVEVTHPDKKTEMFLYELGVDEQFRRRGIGVALVRALVDLATDRGCRGMWVLADEDNAAAKAMYRKGGAGREQAAVVLEWLFGGGEEDSGE